MTHDFRAIPAVERIVQALGPIGLPRPMVVSVVRRELAAIRNEPAIPPFEAIITRVHSALHTLRRARIQPVINATGILVHTNLGRAPLGPEVVQALTAIASSYSNLELDLTGGQRGGRAAYLETGLALLSGAEAATVVNNCAAALVLCLRQFTRKRREVILSRGELVQIGGGFRIPEILEASGAVLREVGTTNRTSLEDYAAAVGPDTALILKVHRSNFYMEGFVASPRTEQMAALARKQKLILLEDLGSGAIVNTESLGLQREPTPAQVLKQGVDLVTFSGDKLLGGPQAGIIAGKAKLISALKRDPLFRALRCDKLVLSTLQATVDLYLGERPESSIPVLGMLHATPDSLRARAEQIIAALGENLPLRATVGSGQAQIGGGTLPKSTMPSVTVDLLPANQNLEDFADRLRRGSPPVIAYASGGRIKLDLRTVFPWQDADLTRVVRDACSDAMGVHHHRPETPQPAG